MAISANAMTLLRGLAHEQGQDDPDIDDINAVLNDLSEDDLRAACDELIATGMVASPAVTH